MPAVSVIIPTYNRGDIIRRAIDSVVTQSFQDYEIIVVDDNSDDNTQSVVKSYPTKKIKYIKHNENKGGSAARNTGILNSKGKYIAFLDTDDYWMENYLERQIKKLTQSEDAVGAVYSAFNINVDGVVKVGKVPIHSGDIFVDELARDRVSSTSAVVVKRECFDNVGTFDEQLPARQDYDMWIRIARKYQFEYIKEPLVEIDQNRTDRISEDIDSRINAELQLVDKYRKDIESQPPKIKRNIFAMHYLSLAKYCYMKRRYQLSTNLSKKTIKRKPRDIEAWVILVLSSLNIDSNNGLVQDSRQFTKKLYRKLRMS